MNLYEMNDELTIFYTDDDPEDLEFFREIVNSIDDRWQVKTQSNGEQLLHDLDNPPPHPYVVFLDINMPGMTGFDVLKSLRSKKEHKELPIVMFSTSKDEMAIERSRLLGATYYMPKPSMFEQLKKSIEHVLGIYWPGFITTDKNFVYSY